MKLEEADVPGRDAELTIINAFELGSSSSSSNSSMKRTINAVADAALADLPNILARKVIGTLHATHY